ncbi:MAG: hypothetical protein DFNUSKGM_001499 [Candidatus Fervidibacter sacchari]
MTAKPTTKIWCLRWGWIGSGQWNAEAFLAQALVFDWRIGLDSEALNRLREILRGWSARKSVKSTGNEVKEDGDHL